jgi:uncharacterized protein YccT (UPF0319 family)
VSCVIVGSSPSSIVGFEAGAAENAVLLPSLRGAVEHTVSQWRARACVAGVEERHRDGQRGESEAEESLSVWFDSRAGAAGRW